MLKKLIEIRENLRDIRNCFYFNYGRDEHLITEDEYRSEWDKMTTAIKYLDKLIKKYKKENTDDDEYNLRKAIHFLQGLIGDL